MKKNPYKLLMVDIDGTLVNNEDNISSENLEALERAKNAGIHISLCTGRTVKSCRRYIDQLGLDGYHVFFDGALVSNANLEEIVHVQNIESDMVRQMIEFAGEHDIDLELATISRYFSERETWSTDVKRRLFDIDTTIGDLTGLWDREEIIRADIIITNPEEDSKAKMFVDHFTGKFHVTEAHTPRLPDVSFFNITAPGLSKGKALESLAARLGIPLIEVAAVGDWLNDIPMISTAGLGIAMGNAHEDLKKVADHVTLDVEEHGLAAAIRRFLV